MVGMADSESASFYVFLIYFYNRVKKQKTI